MSPVSVARYRLLVLLVLSLVLVACSRLGRSEKLETLNTTVRSYAASLRWENPEGVLGFHLNQDDGTRPARVPDGYGNYAVLGVKIVQISASPERTEAEVELEVSYERHDTAIIKVRRLKHSWWYSEEGRRWFNGDGFPVFWKQN